MKLKRILSGTLAFILGLSVINFSAFAKIQKAFQIFSSYKDDHITIY